MTLPRPRFSALRQMFLAALLTASWAHLVGACAARASDAPGFRVERIVGGLNHPIYATHAPGDPDGFYVVQQRNGGFGDELTTGSILRYDLQTGATSNFLTVPGLETDTQGGLHSLAFHPDYQPGVEGSRFYVVALRPTNGNLLLATSHLEEYVLDSNGDPTFSRTLLEVQSRLANDNTHQMDWIGFKPGSTADERDWLYITQGDGGIQCCGAGYVNNSQDLNSLYGKVLRIGVGGGDDDPDPSRNYEYTPTLYHGDDESLSGPTAPEVLYSGLRNPWRASFDRATGDFWLGDVGRDSWEEINYVEEGVIGRDTDGDPASPADGAAHGIDFGWSNREGPSRVEGHVDPDGRGIRPDAVEPLLAFPRSGPNPHRSITGGYVYRGPNQRPAIQGNYFWSDAFTGGSYVLQLGSGDDMQFLSIRDQYDDSLDGTGFAVDRIVSYAEDSAGELYLIDFGEPGGASGESGWPAARAEFGTGEIFRITYVPEPMTLTLFVPAALVVIARRRVDTAQRRA